MSPPYVSERGAKTAAGRLGISVEEYRRREAAGEKWCPRCASWKPRRNYGYCLDCWNTYYRGYQRRPERPARPGATPGPAAVVLPSITAATPEARKERAPW